MKPFLNKTSEKLAEMRAQAEKGFTLLPEGKHLMRATEVKFEMIGAKDPKPGWRVVLQVVQGEPHALEECRDSIFWTEKAQARAIHFLSAFGVKDESIIDIDPETDAAINLVLGRTAIVEVVHSKPDDKGKQYANVAYAGYHVAHKGAVDAMRSERDAAPSPAASSPQSAGSPAGYGDIPF